MCSKRAVPPPSLYHTKRGCFSFLTTPDRPRYLKGAFAAGKVVRMAELPAPGRQGQDLDIDLGSGQPHNSHHALWHRGRRAQECAQAEGPAECPMGHFTHHIQHIIFSKQGTACSFAD